MDQQEFERYLDQFSKTPDWIEEQVKRVPAGGWQAQIHGGENGWNRHQMLAHIATIDPRHGTRVRIGAGIPDPSGITDQVNLPDINEWNQGQVDERASRSVDEIMAEYRKNRAGLIALLRTLTPEQRDRCHIDRKGLPSTPFSEWLPTVDEHAINHMREII